jgi:hypothetical protein
MASQSGSVCALWSATLIVHQPTENHGIFENVNGMRD